MSAAPNPFPIPGIGGSAGARDAGSVQHRLRSSRAIAWILFAGLFLVYNSNGREIGNSDTQPTKFAARALGQHGTLLLDRDVARLPGLATRYSFQRDLEGHFRSAYSPVPAMFGGATAVLLRAVFTVDLDAPLAPNLIAALTASALTATAACLVFLTLVRMTTISVAFVVAIGLALGTNYWGVLSRTLGQHEVVAFGLALALFCWTRPTSELGRSHLWGGAIGLALVATARFQTAPMAAVIGLGLISRVGFARALGPGALIAASVATLFALQWHWFGHPLGATPRLEALHPVTHHVTGTLSSTPWVGAAGLLVSPNRGLLIFSPIVTLALIGIWPAMRVWKNRGLGWLFAGALTQFAIYACYTVWWGGHTYGPRYALDVLALLTPAAAYAVTMTRHWSWRSLWSAALAWSIAVAAIGAFCRNSWNTSPSEVDTHHGRLWDWTDLQIQRNWNSGWSDQNFDLFTAASVRKDPP